MYGLELHGIHGYAELLHNATEPVVTKEFC